MNELTIHAIEHQSAIKIRKVWPKKKKKEAEEEEKEEEAQHGSYTLSTK